VKRILLITGSPGIGKTTVLMKTVGILKEKGFSVGGMISREVREAGIRIGFEILDLKSEDRGWLANVNQKSGTTLGRYHINLNDLETIGAKAIVDATENCDIIAVDEIGPMELFSDKFKEAVKKALASPKTVIAVMHWKASDKLIKEAKTMSNAEILTVTAMNREKLSENIAKKALQTIK
jgi:nucleoside-triphosphatase